MSFDPDASRSADRSVPLASGIGLVAFLTIGAAWAFQAAGYPPCELCLKERIPYYAGVPLAALVAWLAWRGRTGLLPAGFSALALIFAAGTVLAIYHTGVEQGVWPGPASCTGSFAAPTDVGDFLHQLQTATVVRCDVAALHVFGLSLAGWDALLCAALTIASGWGAVRTLRT